MYAPLPLRRSAFFAAAAAAFSILPVLPGEAATIALGGEFQVNTFTANDQVESAVAMDAQGDFVVAWTHVFNPATGDYDIYAQRYRADGARLGLEMVVTGAAGMQQHPGVAMDAAGDFAVVYDTDQEAGPSTGVRMRVFDADGVPLGSEIAVNNTAVGVQANASVSMDAAGDIVVAWDSYAQDGSGSAVFARRFSSSGIPVTSEFQVNLFITGQQTKPSVAMAADGNFVVAWQSDLEDGDGYGIFARRFSAAGAPAGRDIQVNLFTTHQQQDPKVAMSAGGDFVVVWDDGSHDGDSSGIFARRFGANGVAQTGELAVNTGTSGFQAYPSVAMDATGDFVVTFESGSNSDGSGYGLFARRFDADNVAQGGDFLVNVFTSGNQFSPVVAIDAGGDFVVAWQSNVNGSGFGIEARRFRTTEPVDLSLGFADAAGPAFTTAALTQTVTVSNLHPPVDLGMVDAVQNAVGEATSVTVGVSPSTLTGLVFPTAGDWTCVASSTLAPPLTCHYAKALLAGDDASFDLSYPPGSFAAGQVVTTRATVSADQFDPSRANNRASQSTPVDCAPSTVHFTAPTFTVGEAAANATVTVTRAGSACGAASVQYDTSAGSAIPGLDFSDVGGVLSWADGESGSKSFAVPILDDSLDETNERVRLSLSRATGASLDGPDAASLLITDNDPSPRVNFTQTTQTAVEGSGIVTVTLQIGAVSGRNVLVPLILTGTATQNADYFLGDTAVTIPAGQRSASIDLELPDDVFFEGDETLTLTMGTPIGAVKGSLSAYTLTLHDNDTAPVVPTVSFAAATTTGAEGATRAVAVTMSQASSTTVTVPFSVGGTATQGTDYKLNRSSPLTFPAGTTSLMLQTNGLEDAVHEGDETAVFTLGTPANATLGAITQHTRTLTDND